MYTNMIKENIKTFTYFIDLQDFQDIFMVSGGIKSVNDPDQHAFLTSLRFLTHWPIHIIPTHPKDCLFHFFA